MYSDISHSAVRNTTKERADAKPCESHVYCLIVDMNPDNIRDKGRELSYTETCLQGTHACMQMYILTPLLIHDLKMVSLQEESRVPSLPTIPILLKLQYISFHHIHHA
jgi:hypothetical protein